MMLVFPYILRLISHLSHTLEKSQGAEAGALLSTQLGPQRLHWSWLKGELQ